MNPSNLYGHLVIDGVDALQTYGILILKESMKDWLLLPEMKTPFSHDWKDEHGLEVDLEHRYIKEKEVFLKVLFVANSQVDFWNKYHAATEMLTSDGIRKLYYRELEKEFEVYYTHASEALTFTRMKDVDKIYLQMKLHFIMPNPTKVIEHLSSPTSLQLQVDNIVGDGSFTYQVYPSGVSQMVKATVYPITGQAYVSGNVIYATKYGTVRLRVASVIDQQVYAEKIITVWPENVISFADGSILDDGTQAITAW